MRIVCDTPIRPAWFVHSFKPAAHSAVFIAKLTCRLQANGPALLLEGDESLPVLGESHVDDDLQKPVRMASDFVPFKPAADLLLHATAYAPNGVPTPGWHVTWKVGTWSKTLRIVGNRQWERGMLATRMSAPEPVRTVPIDYRNAFGGEASPQNPVGKGYGDAATDLPNLEVQGRPVVSSRDDLPPAGFGPLAMSWEPRRGCAGTHDKNWLQSRWPSMPADFNYVYYNSAPLDQRLAEGLQGNEELEFEHLHAERPQYRTRLPGVRVRCFVSDEVDIQQVAAREWRELPLRCDTLQADLEAEIATLVFRGHAPTRSWQVPEYQTIFLMLDDVAKPTSTAECKARFLQLADPQDEEPVEVAEDDEESKAFDARMDAIEAEHQAVMAQADQQEAEARERALAAGVAAASWDAPPQPSFAEMKATFQQMADAVREERPEAAAEFETQIKELETFEAMEAEMAADAAAKLDRDDVIRMAAAKESFREASLADLELHDLDLSGLDFSGADFTEAMLDGTLFTGANLSNANFSEADLTDANLDGACLDGADFSEAVVEGCSFRQVSLEGTNFSGADLSGLDFGGAQGAAPDFSDAKLARATFVGAQLPQAVFEGANLEDADFRQARLPDARFENCQCARVRMDDADLARLRAGAAANFQGASLLRVAADQSAWDEANLSGADMTGSSFRRAIFAGADLSRARLDRSMLAECMFDDAKLADASLDQCNLLRATLDRADLTRASLRESNLYEAGFAGAVLTELDLRGTSLRGTTLNDE
jgi:uncharacterized protein YjbI with pentapeptide repeats